MSDFTIIIDTREQKPWIFEDHSEKTHAKLDTGDYSIQGLENLVAIERKRNVAEIANNITESRFVDVINRLSKIPYAFLLLEFNMNDVLSYPVGSDIPKKLWGKIRISPAYIMKHLYELQIEHNIRVIFCGSSSNAETMALGLMRKIYKNHIIKADKNDI